MLLSRAAVRMYIIIIEQFDVYSWVTCQCFPFPDDCLFAHNPFTQFMKSTCTYQQGVFFQFRSRHLLYHHKSCKAYASISGGCSFKAPLQAPFSGKSKKEFVCFSILFGINANASGHDSIKQRML